MTTKSKKKRKPSELAQLRTRVRQLEQSLTAARAKAAARAPDESGIKRSHRSPLEHARGVLETLAATETNSFFRTMNERSVDAITELLGDR